MDSSYIREFAKQVRSPAGIKSQAYTIRAQNIEKDFVAIIDADVKAEAVQRIIKIRNYVELLIEDPTCDRTTIANEIESLADFIANH